MEVDLYFLDVVSHPDVKNYSEIEADAEPEPLKLS